MELCSRSGLPALKARVKERLFGNEPTPVTISGDAVKVSAPSAGGIEYSFFRIDAASSATAVFIPAATGSSGAEAPFKFSQIEYARELALYSSDESLPS